METVWKFFGHFRYGCTPNTRPDNPKQSGEVLNACSIRRAHMIMLAFG